MSKQITYKDIESYIYANYEEIAWTRAYKGLDPDILVREMQQRYREDPKEVRRLLRRREGELSYAQAMAYTMNYAMGKLGGQERFFWLFLIIAFIIRFIIGLFLRFFTIHLFIFRKVGWQQDCTFWTFI